MPDFLVVVLEVHPQQVRAELAEVDRPGALVRSAVVERGADLVVDAAAALTALAAVGLGARLLALAVAFGPDTAADEAADRLRAGTGSPALQGYQAGPERVDRIVAAVYAAMAARGIRYAEPPASWADDGQKVRTPGEVLDDRVGTCLDTVVTMAAALEQAGIRPLLWLMQLRNGEVTGRQTPVGIVPTEEELQLEGMEDLRPDDLQTLLSIDVPRWQQEMAHREQHLSLFRDMPDEIWAAHRRVSDALDAEAK